MTYFSTQGTQVTPRHWARLTGGLTSGLTGGLASGVCSMEALS